MLGGSQQLLARLGVVFLFGSLGSSTASAAWNNPYPSEPHESNTLYSAFSERPKHLDPARAYSSNEYELIAQIYVPLFQYHYLERPYRLIPFGAETIPEPIFLDKAGRVLPQTVNTSAIAKTRYRIRLRPGMRYQPHPCFALDSANRPRYLSLTPSQLKNRFQQSDFPETGTREVVAADYLYQIKRLADPEVNSPLYSLMADYVFGLTELHQQLIGQDNTPLDHLARLNQLPINGVTVIDRYTLEITIRGKYPQFLYWLALPFFSPMPPEADQFYGQPGLRDHNLSLDWYPVGSGPYMMTVHDPNRKMVLERNPNFFSETYPSRGESTDAPTLLVDAGQRLPFIDRVVYSLEKESIPYWNKFLQGYYDRSGILPEAFGQAIQLTTGGNIELTQEMSDKGILLETNVTTSTSYFGFNMLDPLVGGYTPRAQALRQALSIAIDQEEYIDIFLNGRGIPAQGPIPPGIFGHIDGCKGRNPLVYNCVDGMLVRKPIAAAKKLLAEAGYRDGRDPQTGQPLLLYLDTTATGPEDKANLDWIRKQLSKLGIQLAIRATDYNRFQEKMLKGTEQLFRWGWNADYPDPENFLFLLVGSNKKVGANGENAANYENPAFDRLFKQMKQMDNGSAREAIIQQMIQLVQADAPWIWGFHPKQMSLHHAWLTNLKPNNMANNALKYLKLDPIARARWRERWNRPRWISLVGIVLGLVIVALPAAKMRKSAHQPVLQ